MLGLDGTAVPLGFILTFLSTLLCIIYGIRNWNKGVLSEDEIHQERIWEEEERKVEETL